MHTIDLTTLDLAPGHLRVFSGRVTAGPDADLPLAIRDVFAPPFAAPGMRLAFDLVDRDSGDIAFDRPPSTPGYRGLLLLQSGLWRADRLERTALYHGPLGGARLAVRIRQTLIPLSDRPGVLITHDLEPLSEDARRLAIRPRLQVPSLGRVSPEAWDWFPPGQGPRAKETTAESREIAPFVFEGRDCWLSLRSDRPRSGTDFGLEIPGDSETRVSFLLELSETRPEPDRVLTPSEIAALDRASEGAAARRDADASHHLPTFQSNDPRLDRFYERSLATAVLTRWEHPSFVLDPHFAAAGLDGGGVCTYLWDLAYISSFLPLMMSRAALRALLERLFRMQPEHHFAFEPFTGRGLGVGYALNAWSLTKILREAVAFHGLDFLGRTGEAWLGCLAKLADAGEPSSMTPLLDYGDTTHLLELRTSGYEHVVPSPNAERAALFETLAYLRTRLGLSGAESLRERARSIRTALVRHLWDGSRQWFCCAGPDGSLTQVDSVQVLTLLGLNVLPETITSALAARVAPGDFLGPFGLHSISPKDSRHYEAGDVDWGGGGSYVGQAPLLAYDLYRLGERARAEDVLERILWWAESWPYFPQSIRADRRGYCTFDRPNCIAALGGAQALIFGLAGFRWRPDGQLSVRPRAHRCGEYEVRNFLWNERHLDLSVDGERFRLRIDGRETRVGHVSR